MQAGEKRASEAKLVGGALCLDLVNTVGWRKPEPVEERLRDYGELLDWSRHAGALGTAEVRRLKRLARERPDAAASVLARARALREACHRILAQRIAGAAPAPGDVEAINAELALAPPRRRLVSAQAEIRWQAAEPEDRLDSMLTPLAWSAADLLASRRADRVKRCEAEGCGWLFLDESRTKTRRWCSMELCGNRAKAKRHYQRHRRG